MANFTTVPEYIAQFPEAVQQKLNQIHYYILEHTPQQTQATIGYGIPTYKYKGNLIHFAYTKNHIGIYPGPAAITFFTSQLSSYKVSKGTIQIKHTQTFPFGLLKQIINYNMQQVQNK